MTAHFRLMQNNMAAAEGATVSVSSSISGFLAAFLTDPYRYKRWMPSGSFRITSANKKIYINDGSDKTITLTEAIYATGALMAAHIVTQLNASSSNWTGSYSSTTYKFTFGRSSGTALFRLATTTDATWNTLGYTGAINDDVGTGQVADAQRNHTSERITIDLGVARNVTAMILSGAADADFTISDTATCVLKGSAVNDYDAASFSQALTVEDSGIFQYFDETLRYWWIDFIDIDNPAGPSSFEMKLYLGDYVSPEFYNLNLGFSRQHEDPSKSGSSISGVPFFRRRAKFWRYANTRIEWICDEDRTELERVISEMGQTTPLWIALDPDAAISASSGELTKYMIFDRAPSVQHRRFKYYAIDWSMSEVIG